MDETSDTIEIKYLCFVTDSSGTALYDHEDLLTRLFNPNVNQDPIEGYEIYGNISTLTIATRIDDKHVVLKEALHSFSDADVYVVPVKPRRFGAFLSVVNKRKWKDFTKRHPRTPIILYQDEYEWKMVEAKGKKYFTLFDEPEEEFIRCFCYNKLNESKRNQLVRESGAVKFVRFNGESRKRLKILLDEMVYAGLGKIMDERERRKSHCAVT